MNPRQACLDCLARSPGAPFEAALWVAAEHDPALEVGTVMASLHHLQLAVNATLPSLPARELAQPLLRSLNAQGFAQDERHPLRPEAALLHQVLARKRGQPLALGLIALELAGRLDIPLLGVNFPGHFLLQVPGADHCLDPCGGRRLYPADCRELLARQYGPGQALRADHLATASPVQIIQRLSRNLRYLHASHDQYMAALKDAERVLELGSGTVADYLARADLYQRLQCTQAERFDVERALLLTEDPAQRLRLAERLKALRTEPRHLH
ncbi:SirB1 family protein [Pseudomonas massiliensis]|uniref:SirB1 family protein n=1 Tax=Pseudomonas massiliensis TaxID=522492 RepID=UPI00058DA6E4|nr:transglutaminase family protein [Pseudomonas massiliensis]